MILEIFTVANVNSALIAISAILPALKIKDKKKTYKKPGYCRFLPWICIR